MADSRYTKIRKIAVGGMAEVWKAKSSGAAGFEKTVAIKMVLPALSQDPEFVRRFIKEAKVAAELHHPNIVQVFDFGELEPGMYFIAMEYVPGMDLHTLCGRLYDDGQRLPAEVGLFAGIETAKALGYAHSRSPAIIHRDISPHNLLVSFEGEVKVADFGIAKVSGSSTVAGTVKGKIGYLSPEQAYGRSLDARSDLFSLGVTLFKLLTAKDLFTGDTVGERYSKIASFNGLTKEQAARLQEPVRPILKRLLQVRPEDRYHDATELESDLLKCLDVQAVIPARQSLAALVQKYNKVGWEQEQDESSKPVVTSTQPTLALGEPLDESAPTAPKNDPAPPRPRPRLQLPTPTPAADTGKKPGGQLVATLVTIGALTVLFVAAGILAQQFVPGWQFVGDPTASLSPLATTVAHVTEVPSPSPAGSASPGDTPDASASPAAETPSVTPVASPEETPTKTPRARASRRPTRTPVAAASATPAPSATAPRIVRRIPRYETSFLDGCTTEDLKAAETMVRGAIRKGVPLFNRGDTKGCFEVYRDAAQAVRTNVPQSCPGPRQALQAGLDRASGLGTPTEKAWAMRDAFDGLLRVIESKKKQSP